MAMTGQRSVDERNGDRAGDRAQAERGKAVDAALLAIEKQFGVGSIMKLGAVSRQQVDFIPTLSLGIPGDAVMALWGAPVAHEDDAERAVRAALAIREAIASSIWRSACGS